MRKSCLLAALYLTACAVLATAQEAPPTRNHLVVVGDASAAPISFLDAAGKPAGVQIDIWRKWAEVTNTQLEIRLMPWSDALETMRQGKADFIIGIFKTPDRDQWLDFSEPYNEMDMVIFFHKSVHGIAKPSDLQGFQVGVMQGDFSAAYLRGLYGKSIALKEYSDFSSLVRAATESNIRVFVTSSIVGEHYLAKLGRLDDFREARTPLVVRDVHAAVLEGNARLLSFINNGLGKLPPNEIQSIKDHWAGRDLQTAFPWHYVQGALLGLLLAVLAVLLYNAHLRTRVRQATTGLAAKQAELAESEQALRESDARLRSFLEALPETALVLDREGRITELYSNSKTVRDLIHDNPPGALLPDVLPKDATNALMEGLRNTISAQAVQLAECTITTPQGLRQLEAHMAPMLTHGGEVRQVVVLLRDVTERHRLLADLQQSQKMEAIGRLAGGVAHDFNNILTAILSTCDLMLMDSPDTPPSQADLEEIRKGALRATALTSQLLTFSRRQTQQTELVHLKAIIEDLTPMICRLIGEDVVFERQLAEDLPPIKTDRGQVEQVLVNLVVNSRDAMPEGGRILLVTDRAPLPATLKSVASEQVDTSWVRLTVSDNGHGMDEATRQRIFEPFFTTKREGKGTGFGLPIVYGIVKQSGGEIRCLSAPGQGTSFELYFPPVLGRAVAQVTQEEPAVPGRGSETILVVEDDPMVRALLERILVRQGYQVLVAEDAEQAEALHASHADAVRLLVSDVVMPGLNGPDLATRLRAKSPGLRVVMLSGYTAERINAKRIEELGAVFLAKPFRPEVLAQAVRTALDA